MLPTSLLSLALTALAASSVTAKHGQAKRQSHLSFDVVEADTDAHGLVERGAQGPDRASSSEAYRR